MIGFAGLDLQLVVPATNGIATPSLAIPNNPFWIGRELFFQALAIDPAANTLGVVVSNPGRAVIG